MRDNQLFNSIGWHKFSEGVLADIRTEASNLGKEIFEANSVDQIIAHIISTCKLEPLELYPGQKEQDVIPITQTLDYTNTSFGISAHDEDRIVKIPAYKAVVHVPFGGSARLWSVSPTSKRLDYAAADIIGKTLTFSLEFQESSATAKGITKAIDDKVASININVANINNDLSGFDSRLELVATDAVNKRFEQVNKLDAIKTALKIPLEKTGNPSPLNRVKVIVEKIAPLSAKKEEPGAYISESDYEHIIDSMRSAGASMETNRASEFQDEEALRDVMLVVLSGAITGGIAGGELFHKKGKTDISIPFENKATFVAECKLWKGSKYINEGIDQLLGYTTWRDAKTTLVIFNKGNANFSAIQNQIEDIFTTRPDYVKSVKQRDGEWRFVLTKPDDPGRQIEIHVLLFDMYNKVSSSKA
ncbi:MAG: hypothetical protein ACREGA_00665 [Candidatus Saccharimonadales bacterium]